MGPASLFVIYQGYGNILYMDVLPELTDYEGDPRSNAYLSYFNRYTQSVHTPMHINTLCKICLSFIDGIRFI